LLRETEHQRAITDDERAQLVGHILANRPDATELEKYAPAVAAGGHFALTGDPISSAVVGAIAAFAKWLSQDPGKSPADRLREDGWVLGGTRPMKVGARDPYLGWGVAAHNFEPFLAAIEERVTVGTTATLVVTGHTHESNEYVLTRRGDPPMVRYHHDYYLDNTIHGRRPQDFWKSEAIPDTSEVTDPHVVWHRRSPLFVQTLSLGPRPSALPDFRLAAPWGRAAVRDGRFGLYDLPPGAYVVRFVSSDRTRVGTAAFDHDGGSGSCGHAAINLRVDVRPADSSTVPTPPDAALQALDAGHDLTVAGVLHGHGGSLPASGTVEVRRAPTPVGGALDIAVEQDEIAVLRRVDLHEMRARPPVSSAPDPVDVLALAIARP
jgi:hypothetical protein